MYAFCQKLGGVEEGRAVVTPGFNLPARFVIHTAGPIWSKAKNPKEILASCYRECMKLAIENRCESVAFPLIGSGVYGCPKDEVLKIATKVIGEFLFEHEMLVYIVVYDKGAFDISQKLFADIESFIDDNYILRRDLMSESVEYSSRFDLLEKNSRAKTSCQMSCVPSFPSGAFSASMAPTLDDMISKMDKGFADTLFYYIDKKGMEDVECYKRSNVDKKIFSKIKCNPDYKPSKKTAVSFAIGLGLDEEETNHLLRAAGLSLSNNNLFDVIIRYFITTGAYESIFDVNEVLYKYDQETLGV